MEKAVNRLEMFNKNMTDKALKKNEIIHFINPKHNYRYERKFTVPDNYKTSRIVTTVKKNKYLFREVYHKRQVNNIYFDTAGYNDYFDNVLGVSERKKIRIRWYGETFGMIKNPVLEIKIKKGLVGDKWSYQLTPFKLDNNFTSAGIQKIFKESDIPLPILESTKLVIPSLLNSYSRKYYLSANNKFRITVDCNLVYYKIDKMFNNFNFVPAKDGNKIVELKYNIEDDKCAQQISTQFPFRINKNSKYVNGVNTIKQFPQ